MKHVYAWRTIDIVTATVVGVFCGFIFWIWNTIGYTWYSLAQAVTPGLGGIATGLWFIGGTLGACIIRKPGAALYVELIAAIVSAGLGNIWGLSTILSGLVQGLGAEIIFLIFVYKIYNLPVVALAGAMSGVGAWIFEFITGNYEKTFAFNLIYIVTMMISGAILAGCVAWFMTRSLEKTGVLNKFRIPVQDR